MKTQDPLAELRIADLITYLAVVRGGSMTSAARQVGVTPSQVSKAISRLEAQLAAPLLARGPRSVRITEHGRALAQEFEQIVSRLRLLRQSALDEERPVTLAAPSYLVQRFVPAIAAALPKVRVRGLELPFGEILATATDAEFDLFFLLSDAALPASWESLQIGQLRLALFAPPATARRLGPGPVPVERIREEPFVMPISHAHPRPVLADDCPLPVHERKPGHQAQTLGVGLELSERTGQLVFGPVIAAYTHLCEGRLVEVPVEGWDVRRPLRLAANRDRVLARVYRELAEVTRGELLRLQGAGAEPAGDEPSPALTS